MYQDQDRIRAKTGSENTEEDQDEINQESLTSLRDGLVEEAERFLAGAEAYFKNLKKEEREDKGGVWAKVLTKIDDKFSKRLQETESTVNGWWDAHNVREEISVRSSSSPYTLGLC